MAGPGIKRFRGLASAIGIAALAVATAVAVMVVYAVYASALQSLTAYASALQKPTFVIESVTVVNETNVEIVITNRGPADAYVERVLLMRYEVEGPPASALEVNVGRRVGVGEAVTIWLPLDEFLSAFYGRDRPLRAVIVTDRGLVTASYPAIPSTIVVNVQLPQWTQDPGQLSMGLEIRCPSYYRAVSLSSQVNCGVPLEPGQYSVCWGEHSVTLRLLDYAYGKCTVTLTSYGSFPFIGRDITVRREDFADIMAKWVAQPLRVSAGVFAGPGETAYATIKLPENLFGDTRIPKAEDGKWRIIDFSWLLSPGHADTRIPTLDAYVRDLERLGILSYYSPAGCRVQIRSPYVSEAYEYSSWWNSEAIHTGIPFYVELSSCVWRTEPVLVVEVSVGRLPAGWYAITPVLSIFMAGGGTISEYRVELLREDGGQAVVVASNVGTPHTVQVGQPVLFYATGNGDVRVRVTIGRPSAWSGYVLVVFSKVVVVPDVERLSVCVFNPPRPLPWATLNVATGRAESNIAFLAWFRPRYTIFMASEILVNETGIIYYRDYSSGNWTSVRNERFTVVRPGWELHITTDGWIRSFSWDQWPWLTSAYVAPGTEARLTIRFGEPGRYVVLIGIPSHDFPIAVAESPRGVAILDRVYHDVRDLEPAVIMYRVYVYYPGARLTVTLMPQTFTYWYLGVSYVIVVEEQEYDRIIPYENMPEGGDWAGLVVTGVVPEEDYVKFRIIHGTMYGGTIVAEWDVPAEVFGSPETRVLLPFIGYFLAYDDADGSIQPDPWLGEPYDTILVVMGARCGS